MSATFVWDEDDHGNTRTSSNKERSLSLMATGRYDGGHDTDLLHQSLPAINSSSVAPRHHQHSLSSSLPTHYEQEQEDSRRAFQRRASEPAVNARRAASPSDANRRRKRQQQPTSPAAQQETLGVGRLYHRRRSASSSSTSSNRGQGQYGEEEGGNTAARGEVLQQQQPLSTSSRESTEDGLHSVRRSATTPTPEGSSSGKLRGQAEAKSPAGSSFVSLTTSSTASVSTNNSSDPPTKYNYSSATAAANDEDGFGPIINSPKAKKRVLGAGSARKIKSEPRPRTARNVDPSMRMSQSDPFVPIDDLFGDFCGGSDKSPSAHVKPPVPSSVFPGNHLLEYSNVEQGEADDAFKAFLPATPRLWSSMSHIKSDNDDNNTKNKHIIIAAANKKKNNNTDSINNVTWEQQPPPKKGRSKMEKKRMKHPKSMSMSHISSYSSQNSDHDDPSAITYPVVIRKPSKKKKKRIRYPKSMSMNHVVSSTTSGTSQSNNKNSSTSMAQLGYGHDDRAAAVNSARALDKKGSKKKKTKRRKSVPAFSTSTTIQEVKDHAMLILNSSFGSLRNLNKDALDKPVMESSKVAASPPFAKTEMQAKDDLFLIEMENMKNPPQSSIKKKNPLRAVGKRAMSLRKEKSRRRSAPTDSAATVEFDVASENGWPVVEDGMTNILTFSPEHNRHGEIEWAPPAFAIAEADAVALADAAGSRKAVRRNSIPASTSDVSFEPVTPSFSFDKKQKRDKEDFPSSVPAFVSPPFMDSSFESLQDDEETASAVDAMLQGQDFKAASSAEKNHEKIFEFDNINDQRPKKATNGSRRTRSTSPPTRTKRKSGKASADLPMRSSAEPRMTSPRKSTHSGGKAKRRGSTSVYETSSNPAPEAIRARRKSSKSRSKSRDRQGSRNRSLSPRRAKLEQQEHFSQRHSSLSPKSPGNPRVQSSSRSSKRRGTVPAMPSSSPRVPERKQRKSSSKSPDPGRRKRTKNRSLSRPRKPAEQSGSPKISSSNAKSSRRTGDKPRTKVKSSTKRRSSLPPMAPASADNRGGEVGTEKYRGKPNRRPTAPDSLSPSKSSLSPSGEKKKTRSASRRGASGDRVTSKHQKGTKSSRKRSKSPKRSKRRASVDSTRPAELALASHLSAPPAAALTSQSSWSALTISTSKSEDQHVYSSPKKQAPRQHKRRTLVHTDVTS